MAIAAILVMWPEPFEQTFVSPPPPPLEAPYEIWLWLAQWFLRRRCLKSVDDDWRWHMTEAYLSYKLTIWAFGSGELKTKAILMSIHNICFYGELKKIIL